MKSILITFSALFILSSCIRRIETTSGPITTEFRTQSHFNEVIVLGNINVFYVSDTSFQIKVEAGERLLPYIQTVVANNELIIKELNNPIANHRPVNVYISTDSLNAITVEGSGNFSSNLIQINVTLLALKLKGSGNISIPCSVNLLNSSIEGSGDITLTGTSQINNASIIGSGDFKSRYLSSNNSSIVIEGSGSAEITVYDTLNAVILGSGSIDYYGNPSIVNTQITGSGTVIPRN
jgi:hypothetical protein